MKLIYENLPLKTLTYVLDGLAPIIIYNYRVSDEATHGEGDKEVVYAGLVKDLHEFIYCKTLFHDFRFALDELEHTKIRKIDVKEDGCVNIHLSVYGDRVEFGVR